MILCIDVGNSHIYGGVFVGSEIRLRFRISSKISTSDELGIFLKSILRENSCAVDEIKNIGICSVVPQIDYSLRAACLKYFSCDPFFLQMGVKTGLNIKYRNPQEVGADRIANAIAGTHLYPNENLIIIDFGTATTFCAVSHKKEYFGGVIMPGVRLSSEALTNNTAKLPSVEIIRKKHVCGRTTSESMQSGLFYSAVGAAKEIIGKLQQECFPLAKAKVIATGGFASLFANEGIYDQALADLVLHGIKVALENNN